jgi:D-glycero-D-manno-heptose 1,7-bisphosphate phosphatase
MRLLPEAMPVIDRDAPALFLDRDGVINEEIGYLHDARDCVFTDGIFELCAGYRAHGFRVVVVTNQSGLARGYYSLAAFAGLMRWMCNEFARKSTPIDAVYYCPFHPAATVPALRIASRLRKPGPGMLERAARDWRIDLARSVLVGDSEADVEAGLGAGVGTTIRYAPHDRRAAAVTSRADRVVGRLADAMV